MKKYYFILIFLIIFIIINTSFSLKTYNQYTEVIEHERELLLGSILKNYPDISDKLLIDVMSGNNALLGENYLTTNESLNLNLINTKKEIRKDILIGSLLSNSVLVVTFIITLYLYKKKDKNKVKEINTYMNKVLNGDYSLDIRDYSEGELSTLKNDIYKITVKLKEQSNNAIDEKQRLEVVLSDISHQIKTPLTSMYVINDVLKSNRLTKNERVEFLNKNYAQLERIEWLVTSLLKLSRLESGVVKLKKEKTKVKYLIDKALEPLLIPIELKNQKLVLEVEDYNLSVDVNWMVEALINIIKNASEHTSKNETIKITASDNPIYYLITIEDNGEGIPKRDLPHIFERFYKGSKDNTSIGIGLNMAQRIVILSGGTIEVESVVNSFTKFTIKIYKNVI